MRAYIRLDKNNVVIECMAGPAAAKELMIDHLAFPIEMFNTVKSGDIYDNGKFIRKPEPGSSPWVDITNQRERLLLQSDWTQMPDSPLSTAQKVAWKTYRQALRDITLHPDPNNITWPQPPV